MKDRKIENSYRRALRSITNQITAEVIKFSKVDEIIRYLIALFNNDIFRIICEKEATRMVTNVNKYTATTWREAAAKGSKGNIIYKALKKNLEGTKGMYIAEQINRNAELIKSIPKDLSAKVTEHIKEQALKGVRASTISDQIRKQFVDISKTKADLIARTEVSKTQTALLRSQAEEIGLDWYIWKATGDQRTRHSHEIMDGLLINWKEPPSPEKLAGDKRTYGNYHAGEIFNCRCYAEPVVDIKYVDFPHKVHINGAIKMMTLKQFKEVM